MELFTILIALFVLIPVIGVAVLIRYVIIKSTEKKSDAFLATEKQEMISKLETQRQQLSPWAASSLENISNKMDYDFQKTLSRSFNGIVYSGDEKPLIAFRMKDRGLSRNCTIVAVTDSSQIIIEGSSTQLEFSLNNILIGRVINDNIIQNPTGQHIGKIQYDSENSGVLTLLFNGNKLADMKQNTDRRSTLFNPFYEHRHMDNVLERDITVEREVEYYNSMVNLTRTPTPDEANWILAIVIFNIVYNGIDFTQ